MQRKESMQRDGSVKSVTTVLGLKAYLKSGTGKYATLGDGLYVRKATGRFFVRYRVKGESAVREYTLPKPYGDGTGFTSWIEARSTAREILLKARSGIDYAAEAIRQRREAEAAYEACEAARRAASEAEARRIEQERRDNLSVADLFNIWIKDGVRRKDDNAALKRLFNVDVLPHIGGKPVKLVTDQDIRAVLRAQVARGVNRTAVMTRNSLAQMFAWAEKRQPWRKLLSDGNPVDLIDIEMILSRDYDVRNVRDRVLGDAEIRELHDRFNSMRTEFGAAMNKRVARQPVEETTEIAIWIMLGTMCRVGELSMSRWEHVDMEAGTWFIPRHNVKGNTADLTVYLSSFALGQFQRLHALTGKSEWCFPARNNAGHINVKSISKQIGDRQMVLKVDAGGTARKPMKHRSGAVHALVLGGGKNGAWTPHDLRRTGATIMQSLGIPLEIIDRCQNHVLHGSKVRRHYLHHDYAAEKRSAWQLLGKRLEVLTGQVPGVIPLVGRA